MCPSQDTDSTDLVVGAEHCVAARDSDAGPVGFTVDDTFVLVSVISCYLEGAGAVIPNEAALRRLITDLDHALRDLPCQFEKGFGGITEGEMFLQFRDGREVRIVVGSPNATHAN